MIKSNGKEITSIYTRDGKEIIEVRDNQNNIVYSAIDEISGSVPLSFMSRGGYLKDYRIYGNTVQNGTPTPENTVEVQGCGERTENLFSSIWEQGTIDVNTGDNVSSSLEIRTADYIEVSPNKIYSFSRSVYKNDIKLRFYSADKSFIGAGSTSTIRLITGVSEGNPMRDNKSFCCFEIINPNIRYMRIIDVSNDLSNKYMMVEGEYTEQTMPKYEPYGYKIPVTVEGQPNTLFTESIDEVNDNGIAWSIKNGFVTAVGTTSGQSNPHKFVVNRAGMSGDFRININTDVQRVVIGCKVIKKGKESYSSNRDIIHLDGTESEVIFYPQAQAGTYDVTFFPTIQQLITTPVYVSSEPLHKIGDYADYVDFNRGVVVRKIKKLVLMGEDGEWEKSGTRTGSFYFRLGNDAVGGFGLCDRAVNAINIDVYSSSGKVFVERNVQNTLINVWLFDTNISIANFKSYLAAQYTAGTPVTIWYVLATPEEEPLENLLPIQTIKDSDILTVDTTVQPSNIWIKGKIKAIASNL